MNSLLEMATDGARSQSEPIDLLDDTGDIGFEEWEKKESSRKLVEKDFDKVTELSQEDWVKLVLYKNDKGIDTTKLFKELFLFCQRAGFKWDWYPYERGPYSDKVQQSLEKLNAEKIISIETKESKNKRIYKLHKIEKKDDVEKLWSMLPQSFKEVIENITKEFENKSYEDTIHYIYSAYPEFAVVSKNC